MNNCSKNVYSSHSFRSYPCSWRATVEHDGKWWCWQHDPEAVETAEAKRRAKNDAEWAAKEEKWDSAERATACLAFFHGRDIPTERIAEGQFWLMADALDAARHALTRIQNEGDAHSNAVATTALEALQI